MAYHECHVPHGEPSLGPVTVVRNLDLRQRLELVNRVSALCLAAVALCMVVVGSLLIIVGLLRVSYWVWDCWAKLELFSSQIELVAVTELVPVMELVPVRP